MARHDDLAGLDRLNAIGNDLDSLEERLNALESDDSGSSGDAAAGSGIDQIAETLKAIQAVLTDLKQRQDSDHGWIQNVDRRLKALETDRDTPQAATPAPAAKAPAKPAA